MHLRHLAAVIPADFQDTPVIGLQGPRQAGKSTLVAALAKTTVSLDTTALLAQSRRDPAGFVASFQGLEPVAIDEIQRHPELVLEIKAAVDRDRRPGRFILTGSAALLTRGLMADSLAGRMALHTLWPFTQMELADNAAGENPVARLFANAVGPAHRDLPVDGLWRRVLIGGFPEACVRPDPVRRDRWFADYLTASVERDARDLMDVERLIDLPRLLAMAAIRSATVLNLADLSRNMRMTQPTLTRYMGLFETLMLTMRLPAFGDNLTKRVTKSPKWLMADTGLMAHLLNLDEAALTAGEPGRMAAGRLLETFVLTELVRHLAWHPKRIQPYHYRTTEGDEVDLILEAPGGRFVGVEVKASANPHPDDFKVLRQLKDKAGDAFACGVVFHTGTQQMAFGEKLWALPVSWLWEG